MKNFAVVMLLIAFVAGGYYLWQRDVSGPILDENNPNVSKPTDFSRAGVITANNPGQQDSQLHLVYEEPGAPALTKTLVFDELSFCVASNGGAPCMAMSVTLDVPFSGKKVTLEGIEQEGGKVLVRKLRKTEEYDLPFIPPTGRVYVAWPEAVSLIKSCKVTGVMQAHSLDITVDLKDGSKVYTVEPVIDDLFRVVQEAESCGNIMIATE